MNAHLQSRQDGVSTPLHLASGPTSTGIHSQESPVFDLAGAIAESLAACDLSNKAAAYAMDLDPSLWSKQLHGDGHIALDRLLRLPSRFWLALLPRLAEHYGLRVSSEPAIDQAVSRLVASLADVMRVLGERR